ncbi:MAG: hypothetical protein JXD23_10405 [Spirochaetales bacterium]|nr:hypothetical protein [Spirochaetales bacterium]
MISVKNLSKSFFVSARGFDVFNSLTYGGVHSAQYPLNAYRTLASGRFARHRVDSPPRRVN